jgi:cupin fold WbuC family metalloprotein
MTKKIKRIDTDLLDMLSNQARAVARRRSHYNFHESADEPVQRFLNVMEPGTYVHPHRLAAPPKWELTLALRGHAVILFFDDSATVVERYDLRADGPLQAVEIPANTWHSVLALQTGTALLELKEGPFVGSRVEKDFAAWAPAEGAADVPELVAKMTIAQVGDCLV